MPARLFAEDLARAREAALAATLRSLESVLAEPLEECLLADADGRPCLEVIAPPDLERELRDARRASSTARSRGRSPRTSPRSAAGVEGEHLRILLCGAGARRGGGVSGIPGRNAAMALLGASASSGRREDNVGVLIEDASERDLAEIVVIVNEVIAGSTAIFQLKHPSRSSGSAAGWPSAARRGFPCSSPEGKERSAFAGYGEFRPWPGYSTDRRAHRSRSPRPGGGGVSVARCSGA